VHIHIIDHNTGNPDIKEAQLGQELEFRIDVDPENGNEFVSDCNFYFSCCRSLLKFYVHLQTVV
jgi:hypothetical protein